MKRPKWFILQEWLLAVCTEWKSLLLHATRELQVQVKHGNDKRTTSMEYLERFQKNLKNLNLFLKPSNRRCGRRHGDVTINWLHAGRQTQVKGQGLHATREQRHDFHLVWSRRPHGTPRRLIPPPGVKRIMWVRGSGVQGSARVRPVRLIFGRNLRISLRAHRSLPPLAWTGG